MSTILIQTNALKYLEVEGLELNDVNWPEIGLEHLFSLNITDSRLSVETFRQLINSSPKLSKISVDDTFYKEIMNDPALSQRSIFIICYPKTKTKVNNNKHDYRRLLYYKPNNKEFQYVGNNKKRSQSMFIEKLSQFIKLTCDHERAIIPQIQTGICRALCNLFIRFKPADWDQFNKLVIEWDGSKENLSNELKKNFHDLLLAVKEHQLVQYVGTRNFLEEESLEKIVVARKKPFLFFSNYLHVIVVTYTSAEGANCWTVYDPNFVTKPIITKSDKKVVQLIRDCLGNLVCLENEPANLSPKISNVDNFIAQGGLLVLLAATNSPSLLAQCNIKHQYSNEALSGLMIRNSKGKPAWFIFLNHALQNKLFTKNSKLELILRLLGQYAELQQSDYLGLLAESLECVSEGLLASLASALQELNEEYPCLLVANLCTLLQDPNACLEHIRAERMRAFARPMHELPPEVTIYKEFKTWEQVGGSEESVATYCKKIYTELRANQLIQCQSQQALESLLIALCYQVKQEPQSRPLYYIHEPNDLSCSADWIDSHGRVQPGPGGALYDFLHEYKKRSALTYTDNQFC